MCWVLNSKVKSVFLQLEVTFECEILSSLTVNTTTSTPQKFKGFINLISFSFSCVYQSTSFASSHQSRCQFSSSAAAEFDNHNNIISCCRITFVLFLRVYQIHNCVSLYFHYYYNRSTSWTVIFYSLKHCQYFSSYSPLRQRMTWADCSVSMKSRWVSSLYFGMNTISIAVWMVYQALVGTGNISYNNYFSG